MPRYFDNRTAPATALPRELLFLLDAVAAELAKRPMPQAAAGLDCDRIPDFVRFHKLQLGIRGPIGLPEPTELALSGLRKAAAAHMLAGAQELALLARAFEAAGIEMLVLKGAALSVQLYGSPLGRYFGDIDLLVRPGDAPRALNLLNAKGYGVGEGMFERHANALLLRASGRRLPIELHTQLAEYQAFFTLRTEEAFAQSAALTIGGQRIRTLELETAIAYAAYHGTQHFWSRLGWLVDIAAASCLPQVHWTRVAGVAMATGTERHLAFALALTREFLAIAPSAPATIFGDCEAQLGRARAMTLDLVSRPLLHGVEDPVRRVQLSQRSIGASLALYAQPSAKVAIVLSHVEAALHPAASDRAVIALPAWLDLLYYLIRPFRVALAVIRRYSVHWRDHSPQ